MGYKILEHTCDLFIQGKGKTIENALEGLALGMFKNMGNAKNEEESFVVSNKGFDSELLIIGLFQKILSECEAESFVPKKMKILELSLEKNEIKVEVFGEDGILENPIKAVTYNSFKLEEKNGEWIVEILFDI